jgi:TfoX/Sxy family transcriptional regulator of competence genes
MEQRSWPKASKELGERLAARLERYKCERRKMFGADVWFVNGNMFAGVFGDGIILRLSDDDGLSIKKEIPGAGVFSPNDTMVMHEYTFIPSSALDNLNNIDDWIERSYGLAASLPVKASKKKGAKRNDK